MATVVRVTREVVNSSFVVMAITSPTKYIHKTLTVIITHLMAFVTMHEKGTSFMHRRSLFGAFLFTSHLRFTSIRHIYIEREREHFSFCLYSLYMLGQILKACICRNVNFALFVHFLVTISTKSKNGEGLHNVPGCLVMAAAVTVVVVLVLTDPCGSWQHPAGVSKPVRG